MAQKSAHFLDRTRRRRESAGTGRYVYWAEEEKEEDAFPSPAHDLGLKLPSLPTGPVMRCVRGAGEFYDFETRRTKEKVSGYCTGAAYWGRVNAGLFLYLLW